MDRRTFTLLLSGMGLGLVSCRDGLEPVSPAPPAPPLPPTTRPDHAGYAERAHATALGVARAAEPFQGAIRWAVQGQGGSTHPLDLYGGHAGVLVFLAEAYRASQDAELRDALVRGGAHLRAQPQHPGQGVYDGNAGRAWAFLALHRALGDGSWLAAAEALAPGVASVRSGLPGDLISGFPGQGLLLLRLHEATGDPRWLQGAAGVGDAVLRSAVETPPGIRFPSFNLPDGRTVFYPGLSHGTAGAGYFLSRLARALPAGDRAPYAEGAEAAAARLTAIARERGEGVNWHRREPDQLDQEQVQWCHGAPGIGIFFVELHRLTRRPAHLEMARRAASVVEGLGGTHGLTCLCHGVAGNAALFLMLHRETGEAAWLEKAERFEEVVWGRRLTGSYPAWRSGDGMNVNNPGLLTGTAGVGWFYLQLASRGEVGLPITD